MGPMSSGLTQGYNVWLTRGQICRYPNNSALACNKTLIQLIEYKRSNIKSK